MCTNFGLALIDNLNVQRMNDLKQSLREALNFLTHLYLTLTDWA